MTSPASASTPVKPPLADYPVDKAMRKEFEALCEEFDDIFSKGHTDIGHTRLIEMDIDTGDSPPITQPPYQTALKHVDWLREELDKLEKAGVIERCVSPWASPIVIVPKKTEPGQPLQKHLCVDYRALNSLLPPVVNPLSRAKGIMTFVPLPRIDELFARLIAVAILSSLDLTWGYHHIGLTSTAQQKSPFVTPLGKFAFKKVPFGLAQAPSYFQTLMDKILRGLPFAFAYLDDVLIFSKSPKAHLAQLRVIVQRLRKADLKLKWAKCDFLKTELQYLGHLVSTRGVEPLSDKLQALQELPIPDSPMQVRQFLGLAGYYRKFVPHYATLAKPLTSLTRKGIEYKWTPEVDAAFTLMKELLQKPPILVFPDPNKPYILYTDASKITWGGVILQAVEGEELPRPITYVSGQFMGSQLNWAALTKEAYAIYRSFKKLVFYLRDAQTILRSNHLPLKKFLSKNTASDVVNNWALELEAYHVTFEYVPGKKNLLADAMSRLIKATLPRGPHQNHLAKNSGSTHLRRLLKTGIRQAIETIRKNK